MVTKRTDEMTSFIVMDVLEKAGEMERRGIDVVHLEVGEPDFDTPKCIQDALKQAIDDGNTHYSHSLGLIELREAICEYYHTHYNVSVDPDQVCVTSGTSPAMFIMFAVLIEQGDEVIIPNPHYACYTNFIKFAGGVPVDVPVFEDDGFQYRPSEIEKKLSGKTQGIFINSPSNPTGTLLSDERMAKIAGFSPYILSDEIYHGLVYGAKPARSILEFTDKAFVLNGFSKLYAMTGLRLGYLIAPKPFMRAIQKVQQNFFISANAMVQKAGITALTSAGDDIKKMTKIYDERRRYMIDRLKQMGFRIPVEPTGAFYVFVNASHLSGNSYDLAFDILEKAHVGVTPGIDFGTYGEGFLRFSYANSMAMIMEGMDRLEAHIQKY